MSQPANRPARYEDLLALPSDVVGQIVAGELIATPRPANDHAAAASSLGMQVGGPFQLGSGGGPGGWWIVDEPELHLAADVLVPDLAGWRRSRMPAPPRAPFFSLSPDWVCEVLSPSTAGLDRVRKLAIYGREQVAHAWLVDPVGRTLEVLRREEGKWILAQTFDGAGRVRAEPFTAVELDLGALWIPDEPPG